VSRRASIIFIVLSGLASLLLLGLLVNQGQILSDLLTQQQEAEARVSLETAAVQAVLKDLTIEIDSLRVQLNDLSSRNVPADGSVSRTKQFLALNQLQSGLHILEQEGPSVGKFTTLKLLLVNLTLKKTFIWVLLSLDFQFRLRYLESISIMITMDALMST
jgi:hypothetical protein